MARDTYKKDIKCLLQAIYKCLPTNYGICYVQTVDPGELVDCPVQTMDLRFTQTIHGLSQVQHDQLNTYPNPQNYNV